MLMCKEYGANSDGIDTDTGSDVGWPTVLYD